MFNAPVVFASIPDIAQIYAINDKQCVGLEEDVERMEQNLLLSTMNLEMIERWENILEIVPLDDDTVEDRRFRVISRVMERLPYSIRVLRRRLDNLCPDGYVIVISEDLTEAHIRLMLKSKKMVKDVGELVDAILPLNMIFNVTIAWNQYVVYKSQTYGELVKYTHKTMREDIMEYYNY